MKYLLANWKMFTTVPEAVTLFGQIQEGLRERASRHGSLPIPIICPPFLSLLAVKAISDHRLVRLGAQNCHWEQEGPHTGEISPRMLKEAADYVLIGHSERRAAGETDDQISRKVAAAAEAGLHPILFVGEDEPSQSAALEAERRLVKGLSRIDPGAQKVMVVYEPTWCVGADRPAEADHVKDVVGHLKTRLGRMGLLDPEVIYGGTVSEENVDRFAGLEVLDGVGATRASLNAEKFLQMVDRLAGT